MAKRKLNRRQQWRIEKIQAEKRDRANRRNDQQENLVADDLGDEQHGFITAHFGQQVEVENADGPNGKTERHGGVTFAPPWSSWLLATR